MTFLKNHLKSINIKIGKGSEKAFSLYQLFYLHIITYKFSYAFLFFYTIFCTLLFCIIVYYFHYTGNVSDSVSGLQKMTIEVEAFAENLQTLDDFCQSRVKENEEIMVESEKEAHNARFNQMLFTVQAVGYVIAIFLAIKYS